VWVAVKQESNTPLKTTLRSPRGTVKKKKKKDFAKQPPEVKRRAERSPWKNEGLRRWVFTRKEKGKGPLPTPTFLPFTRSPKKRHQGTKTIIPQGDPQKICGARQSPDQGKKKRCSSIQVKIRGGPQRPPAQRGKKRECWAPCEPKKNSGICAK